ncbi:MAG: hypothetical protein LBB68_01795, partial [Treponema sp.]|nr:hypothetical protein [Treponema sp.]
MKKIRTYITLALVLAGILLAVSGCTNPIMPRPAPQKAENAGDGAGIALIQFGGGGRTVLPYAADFYYVLDFTPGAQTVGEARTESVSRSSSKSVELEVGDWSLAVKGYIDADHAAAAPAEPGLTGSADFTVAAGTEVSVPVPLTAFQTYEGAGEFAYTVS